MPVAVVPADDGAEAREPRPGRLGRARARPCALLEAMLDKGLTPVVPCQGSVGASGDLAPLAHMAAAMIGVGEFFVDGAARAGRAGARPRPAWRRSCSAPRKASRCSTARSSRPPMRWPRLFETETLFRLGAGHRRARRPMRRAAPMRRSIRASTRCAAIAARSTRPHALRALMAGSAIRASHLVGDERVQDPYCLRCQPQVMGAVLDIAAPRRGDAGDRGQRRHRQSADLRRHRRGAVGRQLPRRAGRVRRRHPGARALRDRLARRAAHRHAGRSGAVGPAGVPDAQARAQLRLHDPAGHGGGAGRREQAARAPGQRRFDPDLGQPGGPRLDGGARRAPPAADGRQLPRPSSASSCWRRRRAATSIAPLRSSPLLERVRALVRRHVPHLDDDRYFAARSSRAPPISSAAARSIDAIERRSSCRPSTAEARHDHAPRQHPHHPRAARHRTSRPRAG